MALTTTTLASAVAASDISIKVASGTGFAAGYILRIDGESMKVQAGYTSGTVIPVQRGVDGTAQVAHATSANVTVGTAADFSTPTQGTATLYPVQIPTTVTSYSASGAITLPTPGSNAIAILNGTSVIAATVAAPTKDMDGSFLWIAGNGAAAHTITFAGGLSGAGSSYDVLTVNATAPVLFGVMACNGNWLAPVAPAMTGTVTNLTAGIA